MRVAHGEVDVILAGLEIVDRVAVGIDHDIGAGPALGARKRAFTEPGQHEEIHRAPVARRAEPDHGLAEFVFAVDVFDQVGLVDNVDQVLGFRHAPEYLADARRHLEVLEHAGP